MDIMAEKIELIKQLLVTNDVSVINSLKSILKSSVKSAHDWADLPDEVITDIQDSLREIQNGEIITHTKARETYQKWL